MRIARYSVSLSLVLSILPASLIGCAYDEGAGEDGVGDPALDESESHGYGIDPIIFVHGCTPPDATDQQAAGLWGPMIEYAKSQGYPDSYLINWVNQGPQCDSNWAFAKQLKDLVYQVRQQTGRSKVDIIAHSMGGLAARLYISQYYGSYYVDDLITIGGGHHGGEAASAGVDLQAAFGYPAYEGMQEMYPPYACKGESSGQPTSDVQYKLNGCLTKYGRTEWRDETPGDYVSYRSIWNDQDEIVVPNQAACLNQRYQNDCSSSVNMRISQGPAEGPCGPPGTVCLGHVAQLWNPVVMEEAIERASDVY
jgi:pimeloyl-ACP methyl ester carboxylesterase